MRTGAGAPCWCSELFPCQPQPLLALDRLRCGLLDRQQRDHNGSGNEEGWWVHTEPFGAGGIQHSLICFRGDATAPVSPAGHSPQTHSMALPRPACQTEIAGRTQGGAPPLLQAGSPPSAWCLRDGLCSWHLSVKRKEVAAYPGQEEQGCSPGEGLIPHNSEARYNKKIIMSDLGSSGT